MSLPYRLDLHRTPEREAHVREARARIRGSETLSLSELEALASDPDERIFQALCFRSSGPDISSWLFEKASERADAEGLLWTPLLESAARLRIIREKYPVEVEMRRQSLSPWVASVKDWRLLEPLWQLNSEPWRKLIAGETTVLPEEKLTNSSLDVRAGVLKNPSLPLSIRHAAAHALLTPFIEPSFALALRPAMEQGFEPTAEEWEAIRRTVSIAARTERLAHLCLIEAMLRPEAPTMSREIFDKIVWLMYSKSQSDESVIEALATHPLASSLAWNVAARRASLRERHYLWKVLFNNPQAAQEPEVIATAIDSLNNGDVSLLPYVAPYLSSVEFWAWIHKIASSHPVAAGEALAAAPPATLRDMTPEDMNLCAQSPSAPLRTAAMFALGAESPATTSNQSSAEPTVHLSPVRASM